MFGLVYEALQSCIDTIRGKIVIEKWAMQTAGRSMRMISYDARLEIVYIAAVLDKRWIPPEATHSKIWATKLNEDYTDTTIFILPVRTLSRNMQMQRCCTRTWYKYKRLCKIYDIWYIHTRLVSTPESRYLKVFELPSPLTVFDILWLLVNLSVQRRQPALRLLRCCNGDLCAQSLRSHAWWCRLPQGFALVDWDS